MSRASAGRRDRRVTGTSLVLLLSALVACGGEEPSTATEAPSVQPTSSPSPSSIADRFAVGPDGEEVEIQCFGEGPPTVVFESGTDANGIGGWPLALLTPLEEQAMVCTYDRPGTGLSDPPKADRRTLDDVVRLLHELLTTAEVPGPYVLVGQSGGGGIVARFGDRYPGEVAGIAFLDVSAPVTDLAQEFPGPMGWNNPEHIDWPSAEKSLALHPPRLPDDVPVLVVTASDGQSDVEDQSFWLALSPQSRQVELQGGHDIHEDDPEAVLEELRGLLASIEGG